MIDPKTFEWENKYTYQPHIPFGYDIVFDEDTVLSWALLEKDASQLCALLNGAYNCGKSAAIVAIELAKRE